MGEACIVRTVESTQGGRLRPQRSPVAVLTKCSTPAPSPTKILPVNTSSTGLLKFVAPPPPVVMVSGQGDVARVGVPPKTVVNLYSLPSAAPTYATSLL